MEDPPENAKPAAEVLERAARDILPLTLRLDHPRSFAFVPSEPTWPGVLADFMAAGYNVNVATWLIASGPSQLELVVIDWFRRWFGYPESAGGVVHERGLGGQPRRLCRGARSSGPPRARDRIHERPEPYRVLPSGGHRRHTAGVHPRGSERRAVPPGYEGARAYGGGRPRRGFQSGCGLRECRSDQYRSCRSAGGNGGFL